MSSGRRGKVARVLRSYFQGKKVWLFPRIKYIIEKYPLLMFCLAEAIRLSFTAPFPGEHIAVISHTNSVEKDAEFSTTGLSSV